MAKRVAILATDGFEQSELLDPRRLLQEAGFDVDVVAPKAGEIRGWSGGDWGERVPVDLALAQAVADAYDALVLPGGVINPDKLRLLPEAIAFIRAFDDADKPIAAICHGPWLLAEADIADRRTLTSWASIRTDLENAGAVWKDADVVVDGNVITSRKPADIPAFVDAVIAALA